MAMGQQKDRQGDLMVSWSEMPRSPGHVFYDRLQLVLIEGGFDGFAEAVCLSLLKTSYRTGSLVFPLNAGYLLRHANDNFSHPHHSP